MNKIKIYYGNNGESVIIETKKSALEILYLGKSNGYISCDDKFTKLILFSQVTMIEKVGEGNEDLGR